MALFASETNYFGLDIGSTGIRLVQLKKGGTKPYLVTYGAVSTPRDLTLSDAPADRAELAKLIGQLVKDSRVSTRKVVAGLPSSKVFATVITTPKLSEAELAKAIKFQAEQYIPMALDQVKLDYSVLETSADGKNQEVLLVAAPNTVASKYLDIFEQADLEVVALEANATALARSLAPAGGQAVVILDLGSTTSDLLIMNAGQPRLIRSIAVGGTTFVKLAAQAMGLEEAQAEQFIYKFGLTTSKLEGQVLKAVKSGLTDLTGEIEKSIQFFTGRYPAVKLEKLIITGGTVALPELPTYLANSTGLPVEIGNCWGQVSYPAGEQDKLMSLATIYAVTVGLAERMLV